MLYLILDLDILFKDLDLALFFILDIKTEKIIEKCPETANYYTTALITKIDYMRFSQEGVVTYISTSQKGNRLNEVIVQQNNINHLPFSSKAHLKWTPICIGVDINLHQVF